MQLDEVFRTSARDPGFILSYVGKYIEAASEATERARRVLLLLVGAAVVTFGAYWNADQTSLDRHIGAVHRLLLVAPSGGVGQCAALTGEVNAECLVSVKRWRQIRTSADLRGDATGDSALQKMIAGELDGLQKRRAGPPRTFKAPIFDVTFDEGDLWLYTELIFVLLLLAVTYCVVCERRDVAAAFEAARRVNASRFCYEMLVSHQVLTVPEDNFIWGKPMWRALPLALILMPVFVQGWATFDLRARLAQTVDAIPDISPAGEVLHFTLFAATVLLTLGVLGLELKYNQEWQQYANNVGFGSSNPSTKTPSDTSAPSQTIAS